MFRTILCPVDFSAQSRQALRYAALLASRSRGRLVVLYVQDPLLMMAAVANYDAKKVLATMQREFAGFVRRTIAPYRINTNVVTLKIESGKPHQKIQSTAKSFGCDLIVMGSHGATGPKRLMFGSTTHRVLRQVELPVLAVPPVTVGTRRPGAAWPGTWALAPIDLGAKDKQDALSAALVANELGTQLLLFHVVEAGAASLWDRLDLPKITRERAMKTRAESKLDAIRARAETAVTTATRVVVGKPAEQIAAAAKDRRIGLVVMTRRRGLGLFGPRQGSISYEVLCRAKVPVLALPSDRSWARRPAALKSKGRAA